MNSQKLPVDMKLREEIGKRSLRMQNLYKDGLQSSLNLSLSDGKMNEELHIFTDPIEIHARAKEAERKFEEILSSTMENTQLPQHLYQLLEEQKTEAREILKEYNNISSQLNENLNSKDKEYREKVENQGIQHELIRKSIEDLVSELNRVGKEEISAIRSAIVDHSKYVSDELWKESGSILEGTGADKPFDPYLWKTPSEMLSLQQMEEAFLVDQRETFKLRRRLLSEVCKLRNELEKDKLNYNLKKQEFEEEIFYLGEKYTRGMPILANMRRKCIMLQDKRDGLCKELKQINDLIKKEHQIKKNIHFKPRAAKLEEKYIKKDDSPSMYTKVFENMKEETNILQSKILKTVQFIFENILDVPWEAPSKSQTTDITDYQEKYWNSFLDTVLEDTAIKELLALMEEYWMEWKTCSELSRLKESLILQSDNCNNFLKLYKYVELS